VIWKTASIVALKQETATGRTLVLRVPGWRGHLAGQHVDVRLTASDGYTAVRSYSIASARHEPRESAEDIELTIEQIDDGEVSPYLGVQSAVGDLLEVRGPIGRWFVWRPEQREPIQLVAGGSGIAPLMAMVRASQPLVADGTIPPMRLLYSVRTAQSAIFADELRRLDEANLVELSMVYTRTAPPGWAHRVGRLADTELIANAWPPDRGPTCYVCGPTPFVETAASLLVAAGHDPDAIRTERFGPV
jgi:ferredoxin-NADP reductase